MRAFYVATDRWHRDTLNWNRDLLSDTDLLQTALSPLFTPPLQMVFRWAISGQIERRQ